MSLTLLLFLTSFFAFSALSLVRPVFGISGYMVTYFACPPFWWWGDDIASIRWNFYSGFILLGAVLASLMVRRDRFVLTIGGKRVLIAGIAMVCNAILVHLVLAEKWSVSFDSLELMLKFSLLCLLITLSIRDRTDLRIFLLSLLVGAAYIGYEATINERGKIVGNRLEGIGAPNATHANELASLMITVLPMTGAFLLTPGWVGRVIALLAAPFVANVVLLCNSRGAFLAAIVSGIVLLVLSPPKVRRQSLKILALGCVAVWFLLGDPRIIERFLTTFASAEELDNSASERKVYWRAGLNIIQDYPLGTGGHGFKYVHGPKYIAKLGPQYQVRSVHQGYINEACEWGVQGLGFRLSFLGGACLLLIATSRRAAREGKVEDAILAATLLSGLSADLVTCFFGDRLDAEWGYWIVAAAVSLATLLHKEAEADLPHQEHDLSSDRGVPPNQNPVAAV